MAFYSAFVIEVFPLGRRLTIRFAKHTRECAPDLRTLENSKETAEEFLCALARVIRCYRAWRMGFSTLYAHRRAGTAIGGGLNTPFPASFPDFAERDKLRRRDRYPIRAPSPYLRVQP